MKMSTRGRYALIVMIDLAKNYAKKDYLSLKEISEKENISLKYLEKIMMLLNKAKFLEVSRGNNGGYRLKNDPSTYKIGDILRVTEGNLAPIHCVSKGGECQKSSMCETMPFWFGLYNEINEYVDSKTLADFLG